MPLNIAALARGKEKGEVVKPGMEKLEMEGIYS